LQPWTIERLFFFYPHQVRFSECYKMKQEAISDLLCLWVPRTDKSCNLLSVLHRDYSYGIFCNFFCQLLLKDELHPKCDKVLVWERVLEKLNGQELQLAEVVSHDVVFKDKYRLYNHLHEKIRVSNVLLIVYSSDTIFGITHRRCHRITYPRNRNPWKPVHTSLMTVVIEEQKLNLITHIARESPGM